MARFIQDVKLNKPEDFVSFIMDDYLRKNGFKMSSWKGEAAFRAGDGFMEGYKFLKWSYANGVFHLEAWMKGSFGGEWNLDGFVGIAMKKPYKSSLMQLLDVLKQPLKEGQAMGTQSVFVDTVDNYKAASGALVCGILTCVFSVISPILSVVFCCLGLSMARMGRHSSKAGLSKTGKVLSIVGVIIAVIVWVLNIYLLTQRI